MNSIAENGTFSYSHLPAADIPTMNIGYFDENHVYSTYVKMLDNVVWFTPGVNASETIYKASDFNEVVGVAKLRLIESNRQRLNREAEERSRKQVGDAIIRAFVEAHNEGQV